MAKCVLYTCLALSVSFVSATPLWNSSFVYATEDDAVTSSSDLPVQMARVGDKRCMTGLGCFEITDDFFHYRYRPINVLPQDRLTIRTQFYLYTKLHPKEVYYLDESKPSEIISSPLDPSHETKFITHGFIDSTIYGKWMEELKDNLLLHGNYNVIIVDWSKGNGLPYTQATANTRVVGAEIALLIQTLQKLKNVNPMDCHIIGHSLGSHIAGYAGERFKNIKLGRITAVDPAQPYFQNMPPSVRIDPTDADFVDAIHTDSSSTKFLALGMSQAVGHVDFYPNNGMNQPGCSGAAIHSLFLEGLYDAARRFVSCNHQRAVDFFIHSINYKRNPPLGYECEKYEDYLDGYCTDCGKNGSKCAIMGIRAIEYKPKKNDQKSVKLYLSTNPNVPFWVATYHITVKLLKPKTSFKDRKGEMHLTVQGTKNTYNLKLSSKTKDLIHGSTYNFIITQAEELGKVTGMAFSWVNSGFYILTTPTLFLDNIKISPMNVIDSKQRIQDTKNFCNIGGKSIDAKKLVLLSLC
ncbi:pancreatic lipase-related protein 2-like [Uloborus diversus]|uniref:pancreatic lipase-related protein 2-like n=1 Tax=Uloborus diversus TaxID=327109 RepID=UPI0024095998|nr:pancreatic lipase-related protein 2-like [Uloborus diversus]